MIAASLCYCLATGKADSAAVCDGHRTTATGLSIDANQRIVKAVCATGRKQQLCVIGNDQSLTAFAIKCRRIDAATHGAIAFDKNRALSRAGRLMIDGEISRDGGITVVAIHKDAMPCACAVDAARCGIPQHIVNIDDEMTAKRFIAHKATGKHPKNTPHVNSSIESILIAAGAVHNGCQKLSTPQRAGTHRR